MNILSITDTSPFPVDVDQAQAGFNEGIRKMSLPKAETVNPRTIAINGNQLSSYMMRRKYH